MRETVRCDGENICEVESNANATSLCIYACIYENYQSESVLFAFVKRDMRKKSVDDA